MSQQLGIIPKISKLLQLKGKNDILKQLMQMQGTPCMIHTYFRLACTPKVSDYYFFLPPDWKWRDFYNQLEKTTDPWRSWIDDAGIKEITTLIKD